MNAVNKSRMFDFMKQGWGPSDTRTRDAINLALQALAIAALLVAAWAVAS